VSAASLALALALALAAAEPRPLSFHATAEKAEVRLGEPFSYEIEVRHRPEESYALPAALSLEPFQAEGGRCRREAQGDETVTRCAMRLALFALGTVDVPDLPLAVHGPAGDGVLAVPGPRITGLGIIDPAAPPESLRLRDLAPPAPLMVRSLRLVAWTLGLAAALVLALLAWRGFRRRREAAGEPPAPLPPHARFARRLDALEADGLPARGLAREHVARLSEIVREYLAALTGANALDLTTAELLDRLDRESDPRLDLPRLRALLEGADLVKFARAPAAAAECAAGLAYARGLSARTRPPEPRAEAAPPSPPPARPPPRAASSAPGAGAAPPPGGEGGETR
jgi:hypothetical protein